MLFSNKNVKENIDIVYDISPKKAPINKCEKVGEIVVFKDGVEIKRVDAVANESVKKKTFKDYISNIIEKM